MADYILAEKDFAQGIKTKNIKVPAMKAVVKWQNQDALKGYDTKKEQVILQGLIAEAIDELNKSQKAIKDAIEDFDEQLTRKPSASEDEAEERVKTFQKVCAQITTAQESKVEAAVEAVWEQHKKRDEALTKINLKFAAQIILNTISLAASITVAALSMGSLAVTLLGAAKTVVTTALLIKDFASGRDSAAEDIIEMDLKLSKAYSGPDMKGKAFNAAKEVAAAAGFPFIDSAGKMSTKLEDFLGKSARVDKETQKLFEQANKLMAEIKKVDDDKVGADNSKKVKEMGKETTDLLNQIGKLSESVDGDNAFYKAYSARCKSYEETNGKALGATAKLTTAAVIVAGIAATAKSIADIATGLA